MSDEIEAPELRVYQNALDVEVLTVARSNDAVAADSDDEVVGA